MNLYKYVHDVPNWPVEGVTFKDITPLLANPEAMNMVISELQKFCKDQKVDAIVSPDARGWLFASPIAHNLNKPLHIIRKPGKLPPPTVSKTYDYEYASGTLEMKVNVLFPPKYKICIIDDVNATGGTAMAVAELLKNKGNPQICYASVIDLTFLKGSARLEKAKIKTFSLLKYND